MYVGLSWLWRRSGMSLGGSINRRRQLRKLVSCDAVPCRVTSPSVHINNPPVWCTHHNSTPIQPHIPGPHTHDVQNSYDPLTPREKIQQFPLLVNRPRAINILKRNNSKYVSWGQPPPHPFVYHRCQLHYSKSSWVITSYLLPLWYVA